MFQAAGRLPLTVEVRPRFQVSPCEICGTQVALGHCFTPSTSLILCQYHSLIHYTFLVPEEQTGGLSKAMLSRKMGSTGFPL